MSKPKVGKSVDDIFSRKPVDQEEKMVEEPTPPAKEPAKSARGRPQEHTENWTKATVVLRDKQIHWLDKLALDIRHNTKASVSRAELIRGILAAIEESEIDLSKTKSESEIKNCILNHFKE